MNRIFIAVLVVLWSCPATMAAGDIHSFAEESCGRCHESADEPERLAPGTGAVCMECHAEAAHSLLHPSDVVPQTPIPKDFPLAGGKMACITCHFTHPESAGTPNPYRLLRRASKGAVFCGSCHETEDTLHTVYEKVHGNPPVEPTGSVDEYTLQCIECHDQLLYDRFFFTRFGYPQSLGSQRPHHSVGADYRDLTLRFPRKYAPPEALSPEIRLFGGKIGCGTCHNGFSKEKHLLVNANRRSTLCMECHLR